MKKLNTRQFRLYDLLVAVAEVNPDRWVDKFEIAEHIGKEHYQINYSDMAHDVCSKINLDRIALNNSLEVDKIILVKDNKFKVATEEEAIELEQQLHSQAMKLLGRMTFIQEKRRRNNQGKIISNQGQPIDKYSKARDFYETFIGEDSNE